MGRLKEVAGLFFKLGTIAFGGPAAHIAMMEEEVVTRRRWMSREYFLDLVGATNLIPGPNSTEMAIHCGFHRAGWPGLITAGICFIFPAVLMTGVFAWLYVRFGSVPAAEPFLWGIRPAVLAVIVGAVYRLGIKAVKDWRLALIGLAVLLASLTGIGEIDAILIGGILGMIWLYVSRGGRLSFFQSHHLPAVIGVGNFSSESVNSPAAISLLKFFVVFLKIGSVLFGSGYVLIAYLQDELVHGLGWLTQQQLLDAVAVGQFTPGPVLSTATFLGYVLLGWPGAIGATIGIFLPSFIFVAILNPWVPKFRKSLWASCFLDSVNVSAIALILAAAVQLGKDSLIDWKAGLIAVSALTIMILFKKLNTLWIILGSVLLSFVLYSVRI